MFYIEIKSKSMLNATSRQRNLTLQIAHNALTHTKIGRLGATLVKVLLSVSYCTVSSEE